MEKELLNMHIEALFCSDSQGRLTFVNEPWDRTKTAPRLYVGRSAGGDGVLRVHRNVDERLRLQLQDLLRRGEALPEPCWHLLKAVDPAVEERCYHAPQPLPAEEGCTPVTPENIGALDLGEFTWLREEIATARPCCALVRGGQVLSVCRSVRIARAHEAGIETSVPHRGRGYARRVLAAWMQEVRKLGAVPLYSTLKENTASRRLAEKSGLVLYATGFHIR